jgi:hypothetical protein
MITVATIPAEPLLVRLANLAIVIDGQSVCE